MSNANFHDRIQRINAKPQQTQPTFYGGPETAPAQVKKTNFAVVFVGAFLMSLGLFIIKDLNEEYEVIRDSTGIGFIVASALFGIAFFLTGCIVMLRAFSKKSRTRNNTDRQSSELGATGMARTLSSLIGLSFGVGACASLFLAARAGRIASETTHQIYEGASVLSIFLFSISALIGFVGVFLRGYSLGRVPVYFLIGALATYSTVRMTGLGFREIDHLLTLLQ